MKFRNFIQVSSTTSLNKLPELKDEAFYVIAIMGEWQTIAAKAFRENILAFCEELSDNFLVVFEGKKHSEDLRSIFKADKYKDPTLIITSLRPDKWKEALETPYGLKICLGQLKDYDVVINMMMRITDLLGERGKDAFRTIAWKSKLVRAQKILGKLPIIELISLIPV